MATPNLQDNLNWLLIRASMVAKQQLMKLAEEYDLTVMQTLTLGLLMPGQAVPMSVISDSFACDPSNVTGIVDRLSVGKYIVRRESSHDRRVKTIELTEAGIALREDLAARFKQNDISDSINLSPEEIVILKGLLNKVLPVSAALKHCEQAK